MTADTKEACAPNRELYEHTTALRVAAASLPNLTTRERAEVRSQILRYLGYLLPKTSLDSLVLFPEVDARRGDPLVAAAMNYDRLAIWHWIDLIAAADVTEAAELQQLLYGLDALLRVHRWKEKELLLASLGAPLWPEVAG
jgi:hypothetical protein